MSVMADPIKLNILHKNLCYKNINVINNIFHHTSSPSSSIGIAGGTGRNNDIPAGRWAGWRLKIFLILGEPEPSFSLGAATGVITGATKKKNITIL